MPLDDDPEILRRPIGFAVRINGEETVDPDEERERLPGLLRFVRTFAGTVLEKEFATTIAGYPDEARDTTEELRVRLRSERAPLSSRQLVVALIDLMDLEIERNRTSPEHDPEEQAELLESILVLLQRLLDRFSAFAGEQLHLPMVAAEAQRGRKEFAKAARRLTK